MLKGLQMQSLFCVLLCIVINKNMLKKVCIIGTILLEEKFDYFRGIFSRGRLLVKFFTVKLVI